MDVEHLKDALARVFGTGTNLVRFTVQQPNEKPIFDGAAVLDQSFSIHYDSFSSPLMTGGAVRLKTANANLLPSNYGCLSGGCAPCARNPPSRTHSMSKHASYTKCSKRLLTEISELLDRTKGKDQSAPEGGSGE
jgi:hypothetical protein